LDWEVPDFSTVSPQKYLAVAISANATTTGGHLLVDSTGIRMLGEGEWKTKIEVTDNATGDTPMLPCLLNQIGAYEVIASVSGDGACHTKCCHYAIARRGAHAIIPTRKNGKLRKDYRPGAASRNDILHAMRRLGRRIWKKWRGYHRRSLVETKNALLQAARGTGDCTRFRPSRRRVANARRHPQSLHPTRHTDDGGYA